MKLLFKEYACVRLHMMQSEFPSEVFRKKNSLEYTIIDTSTASSHSEICMVCIQCFALSYKTLLC